jgi:hypothetical protein
LPALFLYAFLSLVGISPRRCCAFGQQQDNWVTLTDWRVLYTGLYSQQINSNAAMLYLDTINNLISKYAQSNLPTTIFAIFISHCYAFG